MPQEYNRLMDDALSVTNLDGVGQVIVLPNDHPFILARDKRYEAEAQARRDAKRIDANHSFGGDFPAGRKIVTLDGEVVPDVSECYVGEQGWVKQTLRDSHGRFYTIGNDLATDVRIGRVELLEAL